MFRFTNGNPRDGRLRVAILTLLSGLALGCSSAEQPKQFAVTGRLTVGSRPAAGATVTLVPQVQAGVLELGGALPASAKVQPDGTFAVATYDPDSQSLAPGARPGSYAIVLTWTDEPSAASLETGVFDRFGHRYRDPSRSTIRAQVVDQPLELPPIVIPETDLAAAP